MPLRIAKFIVRLLLPQPLLSVEEEPDPVQRQIQGGCCGVTGAVDGLGVFVTAEHLDGLILDPFAVDLDDRVRALHVEPLPRSRDLGTAWRPGRPARAPGERRAVRLKAP